MWHSIKTVAENHKIEARDLIEFARCYRQKYHIINWLSDEPEVDTSNVSTLLADFRREFDKVCCGAEMTTTGFNTCNGWICGQCGKHVYDVVTMDEP